jgi:hypothetical protein
MKKMDKEKALAGILGIVALVCIVVQLVSGGISTSSVAGAIKDLTGIAIQILVFILAIRIVTKKNAEDSSLEDKLKTELEKWMAAHANMISSEEVERKDGKKYRFNIPRSTTYTRFSRHPRDMKSLPNTRNRSENRSSPGNGSSCASGIPCCPT